MKSSRARTKGTRASTQPCPEPKSALPQESADTNDQWEADHRCRLRRWDRFETELNRLLDLLLQEKRRFLVVSHRERHRFVQFAVQKDGGILAEAVSNKFLEGREQLSDAACRRLQKLSWKRPGKRSPNFWKLIPPLVPISDLASLGTRTLRDVFQIVSPSELNIRRAVFESKPHSKRQPKLRRTSDIYEFLVRYPWGMSSINGYRHAARHFGLHTLEDPSSRGWDSCGLLVHRSVQALREASRVSATIEPEDWDTFYVEMANRGVGVIDHDWKHWDPDDDKAALAGLGLDAEAVEYEDGRYRVTLRRHRSESREAEPGVSTEAQPPMTGIEKARQLFGDAGLAFPRIPEELAVRLKELDRWVFSTRPIDMSPYNLEHFVRETGRPADDYAVLAHSGHGVNSYAIQYYLVHGCLRLFLHLGWGGVYMDAEEEAAKIRECFSMADRLVEAAELAKKLTGNRRLTVVVSDFYGSYWLAPGQKRPRPKEGREKLTAVLKEATDWLEAYRQEQNSAGLKRSASTRHRDPSVPSGPQRR
jgi:hypothetical protein